MNNVITKKRILLTALFATLGLSANAEARRLFYEEHPCPPPGGTGYSMGYRDDWTDMQYLIVLGCDGSTCIYPLYGPYPKLTPTTHWTAPVEWLKMLEDARANTTPGAYVGLWMIDAETGDTIRFRNPTDEAERTQYLALWAHEQGTATMAGKSPASDEELARKFSAAFEDAYRRQKRTPEEQMMQSLLERYWSGRIGDRSPTHEEMEELYTVATHLAETMQPLVLRQAPTAGNGQTIIIAPLTPEFAGPVTIVDASGKTMWRGRVEGATPVQMEYPSGTYFVQGDGKPLVVNVVR